MVVHWHTPSISQQGLMISHTCHISLLFHSSKQPFCVSLHITLTSLSPGDNALCFTKKTKATKRFLPSCHTLQPHHATCPRQRPTTFQLWSPPSFQRLYFSEYPSSSALPTLLPLPECDLLSSTLNTKRKKQNLPWLHFPTQTLTLPTTLHYRTLKQMIIAVASVCLRLSP